MDYLHTTSSLPSQRVSAYNLISYQGRCRLGIEKQVAEDWLKVRRTKKATDTETAFNKIKKQITLSGKTANECIQIAAEESWSGFKAEWLKDKTNGQVKRKKQLHDINPDAYNDPDRLKF